ncbi:MAG: 50S ribosomal protein L4 [Akkermansia muciniphila]
MSANTFTLEAAAAANIQVVGSDKGSQAVHDLIVAYQANRRTGSANSKTRAEVSGNNKKIFRQKGTGNARHGDKRAPIFVGGGVVFGPRPCDYSKKVNKSTRRLALRRVLATDRRFKSAPLPNFPWLTARPNLSSKPSKT